MIARESSKALRSVFVKGGKSIPGHLMRRAISHPWAWRSVRFMASFSKDFEEEEEGEGEEEGEEEEGW